MIKRRKWGSILTIAISVIDLILAAVLMTVAFVLGAAAVDLVLLFLAYKDYQEVRSQMIDRSKKSTNSRDELKSSSESKNQYPVT